MSKPVEDNSLVTKAKEGMPEKIKMIIEKIKTVEELINASTLIKT